jgi:hypothetical protein
MSSALTDLTQRLSAAGKVSAEDVLAMRAQVYGAETIAPDDMEALVALDAAAGTRTPEWGEFFAEAMVDFVVHQEDPPDYVDDAKAGWVMRVMAGPARPDSSLEALARMLETANGAPAAFDAFALAKAKESFCAKGQMEAADVAMLRRLVFAGGGEGDVGVTREEADALFDVNNACRAGANDASWPDFFARAVGDSLIAASPFQLESREDAARDEAWQESPTRMGDFIKGMAKAPDFKGALREILHPDADLDDEWRSEDNRVEASEAAAAEITDEEARWLVGRLSQDALSEPEKRLIGFLKARASKVSDLLKPLFGALPNAPAESAEEGAPVFGQRSKPPATA